MKTFRVLVTHAGGPAAISVIKSLKCSKFKNDIKIIAVDSDSSASGLFLADEHGILPDSKFEKSWLESLFNIIKQHNINIILQTGESDVALLSKFQNELSDTNV